MAHYSPRSVDIGVLGVFLSIGVIAWAVLVDPADPLTPATQRTFAVFLFAVILWLTEPVPYAVSSVLAVSLLFALGLTESFDAAVSGFATTLVFFLIMLLLIGHSIAKVELDQWVAARLLTSRSTPRDSVRSLAGAVLSLGFFMPSALARAVTFIPIVEQIREAYDLESTSGFERSSYLVLGHVNPIASMALMTGGGMPIITSEVIGTQVRTITWVEWAILMVPPCLVLYALATFAATRVYSIDDDTTISSDRSETSINAVEPLSREQRIVGAVMIGTVVAWIVGSFLGIPTIFPAILAVAILAAPGIGILSSEDFGAISWNIIFLIGAMFSILGVMEETGTLDLMVATLTTYIPFSTLPTWQVVVALLGLTLSLRMLFSTSSAALIVTLPIVLEFGATFGVDQLYLGLAVLLTVGSTIFLPFHNTTVLLSFDRGPLSLREVFGFGFVTMVLGAIVTAFSWLVYWPFVL